MAISEWILIGMGVVTLIVVYWAGWHTKRTGDYLSRNEGLLVGLQINTTALGKTVDELRFISPMAFTAAGEPVGKTFTEHQKEILKTLEVKVTTAPIQKKEE